MNAVDERADEALAERVAAGDKAAFSALYDRYAKRIYAWSAHVLGSDQAEDAIQDVFMTLWRKAGQFDPRRGRFSVWFMAVAANQLKRELRHAGLRHRLFVVRDLDALLSRVPSDEPEPADLAGERELGARLLRALQALPAEQRRVLVMAYFGGFSQTEIAHQLAMPLGTVKKRVRLGMHKLRDALAQVEDRQTDSMANH